MQSSARRRLGDLVKDGMRISQEDGAHRVVVLKVVAQSGRRMRNPEPGT
jgi:hypothetical protein